MNSFTGRVPRYLDKRDKMQYSLCLEECSSYVRISDETYYALDGPASDVLDVPEGATCMNKAQNGRQTVVWPFAHDRLEVGGHFRHGWMGNCIIVTSTDQTGAAVMSSSVSLLLSLMSLNVTEHTSYRDTYMQL